MGQFRITIEGVGSHHNPKEFRERAVSPVIDADQEAVNLVWKLRSRGMQLSAATFEVLSHTPPVSEDLIARASDEFAVHGPTSVPSPRWLAWQAYKQTPEYGSAIRDAVDDVKNVEGALWSAFGHGFAAAQEAK